MGRLSRVIWASGIVALVSSLASCAAPGVPAAPVAAAPAAGIPGVVPPPAEPQGFFARICAQLDACRRKLCLTPAGQMLNSMTKPLTMATGGIIPPFCPIMPSAADLQKAGVAGASDAIKKDALEAKARREKVRFLGTVDCRYYPDAIGALTTALRTDGSECVRFEAALALARGCCCNQMTLKALEASVSGTDMDGNPAERSPRVRCVAAEALERCLACYIPPPPETDDIDKKDLDQKKPVDGKKPGEGMAGKVVPVEMRMPSKKSVEEAWQTLNDFHAVLAAEQPRVAVRQLNNSSVFHLLKHAMEEPAGMNPATGAMEAPAGYPPPMASDVGTPLPRPTLAGPGRATLGQPKAEPDTTVELGPVPPLSPTGEPPASRRIVVESPAPVAPRPPANLPPNPTGQPPEPAVVPQTAPPAAAGTAPMAHLLHQILHGQTPADRQAAARQMAGHDWEKNPAVASALLIGAKNDADAQVRIECIRQMAAGKMSHPQILDELTLLAKDQDGAVRAEAAKALGQLKPPSNP